MAGLDPRLRGVTGWGRWLVLVGLRKSKRVAGGAAPPPSRFAAWSPSPFTGRIVWVCRARRGRYATAHDPCAEPPVCLCRRRGRDRQLFVHGCADEGAVDRQWRV